MVTNPAIVLNFIEIAALTRAKLKIISAIRARSRRPMTVELSLI